MDQVQKAVEQAPQGGGMDRRIHPAGRRRRLLLWGSVAVGGLTALLVLWRLTPPAGSLSVKRADLEIGGVERAPFQDYLPVRAEVAPLRTVLVSAVEGGQAEKILVLDGAEVTAGQALASLTNPRLQLEVSSKEADIASKLGDASAQTLSLERNRLDRDNQISENNYSLLKSQHDLDVRKQLHDRGFVSDAEVKTFSDEASYYQNRVKTLRSGQQEESQIARSQAREIQQTNLRLKNSLQAVRASLDALVIRAPVAGRLTDFVVQPGQSLKAGDQVGQIDSEGQYKLNADVDEFYLGRVTVGQTAATDIDGDSTPLTVTRVVPQVTSGHFRAELGFSQIPKRPLRRGESVNVRITLGNTKPALVMANGSWLEASGGAYAFVLDKSGRSADRRAITIGRRNPEQVELTSGLRSGDRVVTSSYAAFEKSSHLILH